MTDPKIGERLFVVMAEQADLSGLDRIGDRSQRVRTTYERLVEQARRKASAKAGGQLRRVELSEIEPALPGPEVDILALSDALAQLETKDPRAAAVVKLRFFAGLTTPEAATALGVSLATAENDWAYAKCHLRLRLSDSDSRRGSD